MLSILSIHMLNVWKLFNSAFPDGTVEIIFDDFVTETSLIQTTPSLIAAACICSAVRGLKLLSSKTATIDICNMLNVDVIALELLVRFIDDTVEKVIPQDAKKQQTPQSKHVVDEYDVAEYAQPETPTDVDNTYFCD